jgi:hypothetical protein
MTATATQMAHVYNEMQLSSAVDEILWRVRLIEAQFALMSQRLGMRYDPPASMTPAQTVELLVRAGQRGRGPEPTAHRAAHVNGVASQPGAAAREVEISVPAKRRDPHPNTR